MRGEIATLERDVTAMEHHEEQRAAAHEEMVKDNARLRAQFDAMEARSQVSLFLQ